VNLITHLFKDLRSITNFWLLDGPDPLFPTEDSALSHFGFVIDLASSSG